MKDQLVTNGGRAAAIDHEELTRRSQPDREPKPVEKHSRNDRESIITMLNQALAMELACVLRYRCHHFASAGAGGIAGFAIAPELLKHSQEELAHADLLAARITQLGGQPDFTPHNISSLAVHVGNPRPSLRSMLTDDLMSERVAVTTYANFVRVVGDSDPTTRRMLEDILAQEEEHSEDLEDFLKNLAVFA